MLLVVSVVITCPGVTNPGNASDGIDKDNLYLLLYLTVIYI
jgi:hypothetical protein